MTHADRQQREAEAADLSSLPYARLANAILDSENGLALLETLWSEFPGISRNDVFVGISIAWGFLRNDLMISVLEAKYLQHQLDLRGGA